MSEPGYGVAVDIGTTTVVVLLVELTTGRVVANASALNAQTRMGDNVLTRINLCMTQPHLVRRMQTAVVRRTLAPLLTEAMRQAGIEPQQLACMVVAGNSTMLHLLLGVDPSSMGVGTFYSRVSGTRCGYGERAVVGGPRPPTGTRSTRHRWRGRRRWTSTSRTADAESDDDAGQPPKCKRKRKVIPNMAIHLLPGAAAYVGADITAGVLASGMAYRDDTCLLVDLGTNGELVLRHKDVVGRVCDGGRTGVRRSRTDLRDASRRRCGGAHLAGSGDSTNHASKSLVGGKPVGLCGTAYIDFVARARQQGSDHLDRAVRDRGSSVPDAA